MNARCILTVICVGLATLVAFPALQADHDEGEQLLGTWRVTIGAPFNAFAHLVFHKGNTMTEENTLSAGISMSSGVWKKIRGRGNFATTFEAFSDDDLDGVYDTRGLIRQTIHVEGDTLVGTGTVEIRSLDGAMLFDTLSSPFEATRMTVIRE